MYSVVYHIWYMVHILYMGPYTIYGLWPWSCYKDLTLKGPETIFKPFLKFGQAIVKAIFIKNP
jgi:hypothetical protein